MSKTQATMDLLNQSVKSVVRLENEMARKAEQLKRDLDGLVWALSKGLNVNELGVVQGKGQDLDRLCALRQAKGEQVQELAWLMNLDAPALLAAAREADAR